MEREDMDWMKLAEEFIERCVHAESLDVGNVFSYFLREARDLLFEAFDEDWAFDDAANCSFVVVVVPSSADDFDMFGIVVGSKSRAGRVESHQCSECEEFALSETAKFVVSVEHS